MTIGSTMLAPLGRSLAEIRPPAHRNTWGGGFSHGTHADKRTRQGGPVTHGRWEEGSITWTRMTVQKVSIGSMRSLLKLYNDSSAEARGDGCTNRENHWQNKVARKVCVLSYTETFMDVKRIRLGRSLQEKRCPSARPLSGR